MFGIQGGMQISQMTWLRRMRDLLVELHVDISNNMIPANNLCTRTEITNHWNPVLSVGFDARANPKAGSSEPAAKW